MVRESLFYQQQQKPKQEEQLGKGNSNDKANHSHDRRSEPEQQTMREQQMNGQQQLSECELQRIIYNCKQQQVQQQAGLDREREIAAERNHLYWSRRACWVMGFTHFYFSAVNLTWWNNHYYFEALLAFVLSTRTLEVEVVVNLDHPACCPSSKMNSYTWPSLHRMLTLMLGGVYFWSGIAKLTDPDWWIGEGLLSQTRLFQEIFGDAGNLLCGLGAMWGLIFSGTYLVVWEFCGRPGTKNCLETEWQQQQSRSRIIPEWESDIIPSDDDSKSINNSNNSESESSDNNIKLYDTNRNANPSTHGEALKYTFFFLCVVLRVVSDFWRLRCRK